MELHVDLVSIMPLSGADVVTKHKAVVDRCAGRVGWDALECIVDEMHIEYKVIPIAPRRLTRGERKLLEEELELVKPKPMDVSDQKMWKARYHRLTDAEEECRRRGDKKGLREIKKRKEKLVRLLRMSYREKLIF